MSTTDTLECLHRAAELERKNPATYAAFLDALIESGAPNLVIESARFALTAMLNGTPYLCPLSMRATSAFRTFILSLRQGAV